MSGSVLGRIRPLVAVGVLSLALVTACSSSDDADNTSSSASSASTSASADPSSDTDPTVSSSSAESEGESSGDAPSSSAGESAAPGSDVSDAPSAEPSGSAEAPSDEPAPGSEDVDAVEGTACGGLTVAAVNEAIGGTALESAIDTTVDPDTGESSCIFGTTTTIDTVLVDRYPLDTYLGGELAGVSDAQVLDSIAEAHGMAQTDVQSADSTVAGKTVRTLTGTDLTGGANALSVAVADGNLVAVSVTGPALAEAGLSESSLAVLALALG